MTKFHVTHPEDCVLMACDKLAPDESIRTAFHRIYNEMRKDGCTVGQVTQQLVGKLHDGLAFGNWPT